MSLGQGFVDDGGGDSGGGGSGGIYIACVLVYSKILRVQKWMVIHPLSYDFVKQ